MKILYRIANTKVGNPIIPTSEHDPARQFGNLRSARAILRRKIKVIKSGIRQMLNTFEPVIVTNATRYRYDIDTAKYNSVNLFIQKLLYSELLDNQNGAFSNRWWLNANLSIAYEDGTSNALQSAKNMAQINIVGEDLSQSMRSIQLEQVLFSPAYLDRIGLVRARTFNEMLGLSDSSKSDLAETLARSMAAGKGMKEVTKDIMSRVDVVESRAWRIARTETLNAYRTASASETDNLNDSVYDDTPWKMQQLWFSALSPTTRRSHAARHGSIYTPDEVRDFYGKDANSINCLCSQSPILVNMKTGEVIQEELVSKMKKRKDIYQSALA